MYNIFECAFCLKSFFNLGLYFILLFFLLLLVGCLLLFCFVCFSFFHLWVLFVFAYQVKLIQSLYNIIYNIL